MVDSLLKPPPRNQAGGRRLSRTILLGGFAALVGGYWIIDSFAVDRAQMLDYLRASLLFVGIFVVAGVLAGALWWMLRKIFRR